MAKRNIGAMLFNSKIVSVLPGRPALGLRRRGPGS